jgi:two-component system sensor histidine kinase AgrC
MAVWQLGVLKSCFITIIGTFALLLAEAILFPIFVSLRWVEIEVVFDYPNIIVCIRPAPDSLYPPHYRFVQPGLGLHLLDFSESQPRGTICLEQATGKKVLLLSVALFAIVLIQTWWITIVLNVLPYKKLSSLPLQTMGLISYGVIVSAVIAVGFITKQMIDLAQKESQYEVQAEYINTLDDLFTSIRAQRHDLINHLQTLSGFIQLGDPAAAQEYLQELLGETLFTPEVIIQGCSRPFRSTLY